MKTTISSLPKGPEQASLLDALVAMFEKNEVFSGFHHRTLPLGSEQLAALKYCELVKEATRWKAPPIRLEETARRRLAAWDDLEIRQSGRGILIRIRSQVLLDWWHDHDTWRGDPLNDVYDWLWEET
jgi:hypothetical protein